VRSAAGGGGPHAVRTSCVGLMLLCLPI
jgi:hypothetical protein